MKIINSLALGTAALALSASAVLANEVIIANGCDFDLMGLALVQTGQTEGDNLISEPLKSGDGIKVELHINKGIDLMAVDDDNTVITFENLDLSEATQITLHSDGTATIQ